MDFAKRLLRTAAYLALAVLALGAAMLTLPFALGLCRDSSADDGSGAIDCSSTVAAYAFEIGALITVMSVYLLVPLALAILGLFFLVRDVFFRRRAAADPNPNEGSSP